MKQPEALRLADALVKHLGGNTATQAAAELRRLHGEIDSMRVERVTNEKELRRLHEVNQELLATMEKLACLGNGNAHGNSIGNDIAIAAIAKAGGAA